MKASFDARTKAEAVSLIQKKMLLPIGFVAAIAFVTVTADRTDQIRCPRGWSFFENSCYFIGNAQVDFKTAESLCEAVDGKLATISSPEENDEIKKLLQDDDAAGAWFGLKFYDTYRGWMWRNLNWRISLSFLNWAQNEPVTTDGVLQDNNVYGGPDVWLAGSDNGTESIWYWDTYGQKQNISNGFTDWRIGQPNNAGRSGAGSMLSKETYILYNEEKEDQKEKEVERGKDIEKEEKEEAEEENRRKKRRYKSKRMTRHRRIIRRSKSKR
ncbi:C-type lectin domain family 4 member m [Plakobranchus ocellatus]|uniref:C-type lectin domain family 4 member m n=1 Tax=Plakobranchus ocellatus TaxID=259542 RepID=A0AAV4BIW9_9GAST|nr:C-type lectin domain family 4 member m [Plakobranchus ocellatus]